MSIQSIKTSGSGALSFTTSIACPFEFSDIRLTLDQAASAGSLITKLDSVKSSNFDVMIDRTSMKSVKQLHLIQEEELRFDKDDEINLEWTNPAGRTWALEVRVVS